MKVLHLASGDLWAGAEMQLYILARELRHHIDIKVVLLNRGVLAQRLADEGIDVAVLDEARLSAFAIITGLQKVCLEFEPDVIHTHRFKENILGSLVAMRNRVPSVRTAHGLPESPKQLWALHKHFPAWLDRFSGRYIQKKIVAVAPDLAVKLRPCYGEKRVAIIENGIDIAYVRHQATLQQALPQTLLGDRNIAFVGRLVPVKRLDILLDAMAQLKAEFGEQGGKLFIIGDGPMRDSMEQKADALQLADSVQFIGEVTNPYVYMAQMDAVILCSDHEGLPMTLLESMALEVPIIAHNVGGIGRLLRDGEAGLLVDRHEPDGYAQGIMEVYRQPEKTAARTKVASDILKAEYSVEANGKSYLQLYRQLLQ